MFKKMKLRSIITLAVAIIAFAGITFLYITANNNMSAAMKESELENMKTSLEGQAAVGVE